MKTMKKSLAVFLAVLCLFSALSVTSFAATKYKSYKGKYGLMVPVDSDYKKECEAYEINSDKGSLYFSFKSKGHKKSVYFGLTIYSDEARQDILINKSGAFPTVNSKGSMSIDFSPLESGTYYGLTFTYVKKGDDLIVDKDSIYTFDIKLNKLGEVTPKITEAQALYSGNFLKWKSVKYADFYRVYRKQDGTEYEKIADVTSLEYIDKNAVRGEEYTYTVRAFDEDCYSKHNKNGVDLIYLAPPMIESPEILEDNKIKISWEAVEGAEKYRVYKKTEDASKYTRIATVDADITEYVDKASKKDGETYIYAVKATNGINAGILSNKSEITLFGVKKPVASCVGETVTIRWDAVEDATNYKLYKKNSDEQWEMLCSGINILEFVDTDVHTGNKYDYSLVVERDGQFSSFDTKGVTAYCLAEPKIKTVKSSVEDSVYISWNKIEGATKYNIYRDSPFEDFKLIGTTTKTSFYDTADKDNNFFYTYYVEAANEAGAGISGNNMHTHLYMRAPELTSVKWDNGNVVKWKRVPGAISYVVMRRTPSGEFKKIAEVKDGLSYKDKKAKKSTKYYYTVAAINGRYQGAYEIGLGVNCLNAPEITSLKRNSKKQPVVKWSEVSGATGYYVYRKATVDGSWETLGKTTKLTYTDKTSREKGVDYYYTVRAYNSKGKGIYSSFGVKL